MIDSGVKQKFTSWPSWLGAGLSILCGWILWATPLGDPWSNGSYDYLFRFGSRALTNQVALILMDDESYVQLHQNRSQPWDRALHTKLLNQLAVDEAAMVVFDIHFEKLQAPEIDAQLAAAMRRQKKVILMADILDSKNPGLQKASVWLPQPIFLQAAAGFGVGHADADICEMDRRHWPFFGPGEGDFHSLGWAAAKAKGGKLDPSCCNQWLRYYGENGAWETLSYYLALGKPPGFFHGKDVFIGNGLRNVDPGLREEDKLLTPYTRWNSRASPGMEIMATTYLNLLNNDWLRRLPDWIEALLLTLTGLILGWGLCQLKPVTAAGVSLGTAIGVMLVCVCLSYFTNYWFPWLIVSGGQIPCALGCTLLTRKRALPLFTERFPGYTTVGEPFGEGAYGRVWLVRDATGQLQALKEVNRKQFLDADPYEREFRGIKAFKPLSHQHLGLLHIDHVNRNDHEGYFYYVMELGDPLDPGWQEGKQAYQARDLFTACSQTDGGRLPAQQCVRIGIALLEPLVFLHEKGLVHRDIKPSNVVFVKGKPKLADVGLVRSASNESTWVGTDSYMPPWPERPGTVSADIYAMGKLLYVISTGRPATSFPELSTTLVQAPEFMRLNQIICKACQPIADDRYLTAVKMLEALQSALVVVEKGGTRKM